MGSLCISVLVQAARVEPQAALVIKNKGRQKIHVLIIQSNDFRHVLDAGGWTNKTVKQLLDLSTEVLTFLPDVEKAVKKNEKDKDNEREDSKKKDNAESYEKDLKKLRAHYEELEEGLEKKYTGDELDRQKEKLQKEYKVEKADLKTKYHITKAKKDIDVRKKVDIDIFLDVATPKKSKITKEDIQKAELWIKATKSFLSTGGQFLGDVLPHIALAAIQKKDYATQIYPGVRVYFYKSTGKKPHDAIMHLKDLTLAIFPDDGFGVTEFNKPLFVRSFDAEKYNGIYYGPEDGHVTFKKIDFATGDVLKATEKSFLPVENDKKEDKISVPDEGDDVLDEVRRAKEDIL